MVWALMSQNKSLEDKSQPLYDARFRNMVNDACIRIQTELMHRAPFLGEQVCGWMSRLSPTSDASEYFLQPRVFPFLLLPWWAARAFAAEPDREFLVDVVYSTVNGYYYIRLLDNLMDGHGTVELKILPATAFFHTEFQATYQKYFDAVHPFWEIFRSAWFSASDAVTRESDLDCMDQVEFERVTVVKLAGSRIPLAAVAFRHDAGERLQCWEKFALALARWSQMEDDLFDWHDDLRHGKTSHFLTEAGLHQGLETVEAWIIREGFQQGITTLQRELDALRHLVPPLNSPDVVRYLDARETILERLKTSIGAGFRILEDVASITEAPTAQAPD
jgi:hypothetical protein